MMMASQRLEVGKLVAQPFDAARAGFEALVTTLSTAETLSKTHSELEGLLQTDGAELMRELLQGHLTLRGPGRVPTGQVVGEDDVVRTHQRMRDRVLMTVFGAVLVARVAFGARKHDALMPLDGALNLPVERYSHGLRRLVAEETAKTSFEEVVATVAKTTAATIPKRQVEQLAVRAAQDFDAFYETRAVATPEEVAKTGEILVVTGDGKGVRMHRADLREATRKAAEQRAAERTGPARFSLGLPKPADVERDRKRMAEVAAVYTIQRFVRTPEDVVGELQRVQLVKQKRPRPEHKRVWASIRKSPEDVLQTAFDEALRRDPELRKTWVALVDGNETQFTILDSMASIYNVNLTVIIDIIHVIQYVWKAAFALNERGTPEAEKWVRERVLEILRGNASLVAAGMRRSATLRGLTVTERGGVDECANYLLKYSKYMNYNEYLAKGFPIATGVIEGACRYLVKDRMEITGAVWGLDSAEAVLQLRALRASQDFDEYWQFHEAQERRRNHVSRYAHGLPGLETPAPPRTGRERHLRVVN